MAHNTQIQELTLEDVMGDRFGRYSKYIIQERALPDIRDGLKPVQRRILFAMNQDGNTFDKAFRKSAKSVGNIMGNFHPHGDSSIYEAMVRMSQDWKLRHVLVEMHGNNGSMDGDSPAAMRYTEARLSQIAGEMLQDIDKETVDMVLNFDDTEYEPTVLPAHYPNLLVNGTTGISAGYATEIPPHNLGEVIDAVIYLIKHPDANLEDLMQFVKGPDFPTGGILQGLEGIKQAYETGRGKVILRSKTEIQDLRGGKQQIAISEIPYEVNKAVLVKKMDELRVLKKVDGIAEVRDESDRMGLSVVVELKKEANAQGILNYLFKNTDLQVSYNFNMVAIDQKRPQQVGLLQILKAYIAHQQDVITRRTRFDLNKALKREHIVEGLMKMLSILDQVIQTIRASKDKKDAKQNLITQFSFSEPQAEAIVSLQLYRLTNTDITALEKEARELADAIAEFRNILENPAVLFKTLEKEIIRIKKTYANPRLTEIEAEIETITIDTKILVAQEDVMVSVSSQGYFKRSSLRSFSASGEQENGLKDGDFSIFQEKLNTLDHLLIFTTKGNVIYRQVHEIADLRWKDTGEHVSQTIGLAPDELLLTAYSFKELDAPLNFLVATRLGMIKQSSLADFKPGRGYKTRASMAIKLKSEADQVIAVELLKPTDDYQVTLMTYGAYGLKFNLDEVPVVGSRAAGVKAMNLKAEDYIVNIALQDGQIEAELLLISQRGAVKKMSTKEIPLMTRAKRGVQIFRELKANPHRLVLMKNVTGADSVDVLTDEQQTKRLIVSDYPNADRYSNGSFAIDVEAMGVPYEGLINYPEQIEESDETDD